MWPWLSLLMLASFTVNASADSITGCGGFVEASAALVKSRKPTDPKLDYSDIVVELCTIDGLVKDSTQCAPNGYYFIPVYDKGSFIIKIKGPEGWSWEPKEVPVSVEASGCNDNEDINFKFTGFSISGRVLGAVGGESCPDKVGGPTNIKVELASSSNGLERSVLTEKGGFYNFENVAPGTYTIGASHSTLRINQLGSSEIQLGFGNMELDNIFQVSGYDINGSVVSQGDPVLGVHVFLYSDDIVDVNCDKDFEAGPWSKQALCHAFSDSNGKFSFSNIPCGKYTLVPFYEGENTVFDVSPPSAQVLVEHSHVTLPQPFQVTGFSVGGRVIDSLCTGVEGVKILLDGRERATTDRDGFYKLDQVTSTHYTIKAEKTHFKFTSLEKFMVLPNMTSIPELAVTHYDLCGSIILATADYSERRQVALTHGPENTKPQTKRIDENGRFCFEVQPGEYRVSPLTLPKERDSGLLFSPSYLDISVNRPILDVRFAQALVEIHGSVSCKNDSDSSISVSLTSLDSQRLEKFKSTTLNDNKEFMFEKVLPGKYQLEIRHRPSSDLPYVDDDWCWERKLIDLNVGIVNVMDISFVQKGYWMQISSTHDVFTHILGPEQEINNYLIKKGWQNICLESPGLYNFHFMNSCIFFGMDSLAIDVPANKPLYLTGQKYLVSGEIHVDLSSCNEANKLSERIAVDIYEGSAFVDSISEVKLIASANETSSTAIYQYSYWAQIENNLVFVPRDSGQSNLEKLLFYPRERRYSVKSDGCQPPIDPFVGRVGRYIQGSVVPAIAGVSIKIFAQSDSLNGLLKKGDIALSIFTGSDGLFSGGPLYDDADYYVEAVKPGYHLKPLGGFNFSCQKLSQIKVYINAGEGAEESLPPVLLSLSGEDGYRNNAITNSGGTYTFDDLFPGSFYLRPLMKEYSFTPSALALELDSGEAKEVVFIAYRVSYSILGTITSLSGQPREGISLEARSLSKGYYEEATTDAFGKYRLRGLIPNTSYSIRIQFKEDLRKQAKLERASPSSVTVQVGSTNIEDLDFILFDEPEKTIISGYVEGPNLLNFQPNLAIRLRSALEPLKTESVLPLPMSYFFEVRDLPKGKYVLEILSHLSSREHKFESNTIEVDLENHPQIDVGALTYTVEEIHHKQELTPVHAFPLIVGVLVIVVFISMPRLRDMYNWALGMTPAGVAANAPKKETRKLSVRKRTY